MEEAVLEKVVTMILRVLFFNPKGKMFNARNGRSEKQFGSKAD